MRWLPFLSLMTNGSIFANGHFNIVFCLVINNCCTKYKIWLYKRNSKAFQIVKFVNYRFWYIYYDTYFLLEFILLKPLDPREQLKPLQMKWSNHMSTLISRIIVVTWTFLEKIPLQYWYGRSKTKSEFWVVKNSQIEEFLIIYFY